MCLLAAIVLNTSCDDQLNALPSQSKVDDNIIVDQQSAEVALNGVYYVYSMCGTDNYNVPCTRCFLNYEIYPAQFSGLVESYRPGTLESHSVLSTDYAVESMWYQDYQTLSAANVVIDQMTQKPDNMFSDNRKAEIIGEATLLRAFAHYDLLRHFAQFWDINSSYGVLLRMEAVKTGNIAKARSTVKESYDCILADVETAITNCSATKNNTYLTKWTAKGLKARVLMMRGASGDYASAADITHDIIQNSPYSLETNIKDLFRVKGQNSSEVMFAIQPKANQTKKYNSYFLSSSVQYVASSTLKTLLRDDPRITWMIGTIKGDGSQYADLIKTTDRIGVTKYGQLGKSTTLWEVSYQMRLSEIYLIRAEALVRSGGDRDEAKNLLKTVMSHAGVTDFSAVNAATTDEAILIQIFYEMEKNLFCENGQELDAQMRMPVSAVQTINPAIIAKDYMILPIPADEFTKNPTIGDQNPGYSKI